MTRPAPTHAAKSPATESAVLPPCMANPQLWDSTDNAEAIAACRRLCPRRVACAQEVLSNVQNIDGVVAGVALPAQNEHGTSKRRRAAVQHIQAIAAQRPQPTKADPTTQPGPAGSRGYHAHHGSAGQPEIADRQGSAAARTTRPAAAQRSCGTTAVIERADDISSRHVGQTGAAELTGLSKDYLKQLRRLRKGPKWWRTATGEVRYWVIDIEKWMSRRQRSQILSGGRRRNHHRSAANYPHPRRPVEHSTARQLSLFESPDIAEPGWSAPSTVRHLANHQGFRNQGVFRPRELQPGQCDLAGAALITGLTHNRLRAHHKKGTGPKSWVSGGGIRYWEADVRAWREQLPDHSGEEPTATEPIAQAS
ncbi:hypothetical protein ACNQVK_04555 [Mycobacterium sp. 134]|uniref:hypothetical protein n=1 Tax=Mycobacteriaceae TaxID=1762 RepID=UPI003AB0E32D